MQVERGLMARLEGGCQLALGANAQKLEAGVGLLAWYGGRFYRANGSSQTVIAQIHDQIMQQMLVRT